MRISVFVLLMGVTTALASSLDDASAVVGKGPRMAVRRGRTMKSVKQGFNTRDGAAHDHAAAAAAPADSYPAAPAEGGSYDETDENGYYYYYYPVEEEGYVDEGQLVKSNEEVLIGLAVAILVIVIVTLATIWIPIGALVFGGSLSNLNGLFPTSGWGLNIGTGSLGIGRTTEAISEYMPWETINQLSMLVSNAIESDQCIERLACETGKYADGHTFLVSFLESFAPEGFKNSMKVFKDSALKKTDCRNIYFCGSLDGSSTSNYNKTQ